MTVSAPILRRSSSRACSQSSSSTHTATPVSSSSSFKPLCWMLFWSLWSTLRWQSVKMYFLGLQAWHTATPVSPVPLPSSSTVLRQNPEKDVMEENEIHHMVERKIEEAEKKKRTGRKNDGWMEMWLKRWWLDGKWKKCQTGKHDFTDDGRKEMTEQRMGREKEKRKIKCRIRENKININV